MDTEIFDFLEWNGLVLVCAGSRGCVAFWVGTEGTDVNFAG